MKNFSELAYRKFGVAPDLLYDVLNTSAGADGYIFGALGEMLFKQYAEEKGYEVKRIKEKPKGGYDAKTDEARGDFYIRKRGCDEDKWFVVECKSVKSNSEKRCGFTDKSKLATFLAKHSFGRERHIESIYRRGKSAYNRTKESFADEFPEFRWNSNNPGAGIPNLSHLWNNRAEIDNWLNTFGDDKYTERAYWDLEAPVRLIQTHMPSQRVDKLGIKSTGPLVADFSILCVDLFLRTGEHKFIFANSQNLNHQAEAPNHLQQNYTIDILVEQEEYALHELSEPWYDDLELCITETNPVIQALDLSQLDDR